MPATKSRDGCVVRSASPWAARLVLCVLAFLATGVAAYWLGAKTPDRTKMYSATASIFYRHDPSDGRISDGLQQRSTLGPATIEQEILSDENLQQALHREGREARAEGQGASDSLLCRVEQIRRNLRVTATEASRPGALQISISCVDGDPDRAMRLVNTVAEAYAARHRAHWETTARQEYLQAQDAAERARQEYLEAKGRLDDFVEQHFLMEQALAERWAKSPPATTPAGSPTSREPARPAPPQTAVDPEKIDLERQLADLQRRRSQLLENRTPLHPQVRDIEVRIAGVRERLDSPLSSDLIDERPDAFAAKQPSASEDAVVESRPGTTDEVSLRGMAEERAEVVRAFDAYKEALDLARQEYDRRCEVKRRAWEQQVRRADIELETADQCQVSPSAGGSSRGLLGALAAALVVAVGVGLISSGFDTDPPLSTRGQAEAALPAPIVGAIPATGTSPPGADGERSRPASGLAKIAYGVFLIAVCFAVLVVVY